MNPVQYLKEKLVAAQKVSTVTEIEVNLSFKGVEPLLSKALLHANVNQYGVHFLSLYKEMSVTLYPLTEEDKERDSLIEKDNEKSLELYIKNLKEAIDMVQVNLDRLHSEVFIDEDYNSHSIIEFSEEDTYIDYQSTTSINLFGWWEREVEKYAPPRSLDGSQGLGVKIFSHSKSMNYGLWHLIKRMHSLWYVQGLLDSKPEIKSLTTRYERSFCHMVSGKKGGRDLPPVMWAAFNSNHKTRRVWIRVEGGRNFVITMQDFPIIIKDDMWKEFKVTKEGVDIKSVTPTENDLDRLVARKKGCHYFYTGS